jgi:hypothetical protein
MSNPASAGPAAEAMAMDSAARQVRIVRVFIFAIRPMQIRSDPDAGLP